MINNNRKKRKERKKKKGRENEKQLKKKSGEGRIFPRAKTVALQLHFAHQC